MMIASTAIVAGLNWWQAWIAVWIAYALSAVAIVLNAKVAAVHHVGFPPLVRASFGLFGSIWPVLNRIVVACIWFSVQSCEYQRWLGTASTHAWTRIADEHVLSERLDLDLLKGIGGECMNLALRSWAPSWSDPSPQLSGVSRNDFVSFLLFWLIQFPTTWVSPQNIRHLFTAKAVAMPVAAFGLFGWTVSRAGGLGPIVHQPAKLHGSTLGWAFVLVVMSQCSNMITLCVNSPDFARMAKHRNHVVWPQLIAIPSTFAITSLIGILISSSSYVLFGKDTWNPIDILDGFLDQDPHNASTRAGVFFIAAAFMLATIGTNLAANSLSCGSDLTALIPRYVSIQRGQVLCALLSLVMCPWHYATSSGGLTTYLSAYSVLLAPILGVMLADSYIVRRGKIDVPSLYIVSPESHAIYNRYGFNWRAYTAYLIGCAINLPGFVATVSPSQRVPEGLMRVYQLAFLTGSLISALVYTICNELSPMNGGTSIWERGWKLTLPKDEVDFDGTPFDVIENYSRGTGELGKANDASQEQDVWKGEGDELKSAVSVKDLH